MATHSCTLHAREEWCGKDTLYISLDTIIYIIFSYRYSQPRLPVPPLTITTPSWLPRLSFRRCWHVTNISLNIWVTTVDGRWRHFWLHSTWIIRSSLRNYTTRHCPNGRRMCTKLQSGIMPQILHLPSIHTQGNWHVSRRDLCSRIFCLVLKPNFAMNWNQIVHYSSIVHMIPQLPICWMHSSCFRYVWNQLKADFIYDSLSYFVSLAAQSSLCGVHNDGATCRW